MCLRRSLFGLEYSIFTATSSLLLRNLSSTSSGGSSDSSQKDPDAKSGDEIEKERLKKRVDYMRRVQMAVVVSEEADEEKGRDVGRR